MATLLNSLAFVSAYDLAGREALPDDVPRTPVLTVIEKTL